MTAAQIRHAVIRVVTAHVLVESHLARVESRGAAPSLDDFARVLDGRREKTIPPAAVFRRFD